MTVNEILTLVNFIINKESTGDVLTPANYNPLLKETNISLFNEFWGQYLPLVNNPQLQYVLSDSPLATFVIQATADCSIPTGLCTLPTDLVHLLSISSATTGYNVEIITPTEANRRRGSIMSISAWLKPYGYVTGGSFQVYPYNQSGDISQNGASTTVPMNTVYLRIPLTPYFDYCQSTVSLKRVFMPQNSFIIEYTTPGVRYDLCLGAETLETNVTRTGISSCGSTGCTAYVSLTQELEWREDVHPLFVSRLLSKTGISLSEPAITQYAELLRKEGE